MREQRVIIGNAAEVLKEFPDESIDCVVTSPPYYALRDYGVEPVPWPDGWVGQLGHEPDPDQYIAHLMTIFDEIKRVLNRRGTCWVNIGDSYNRSWGDHNNDELYCSDNKGQVRYGVQVKNVRTMPTKCLIQIPARFGMAMVKNDWILRNRIIWYKPNAMPSSTEDRFGVDYEEILFFTKSQDYYFKHVREVASDPVGKVKKFGGAKTLGANAVPGKPANRSGRKPFVCDGFRNKRSVWTIPTGTYTGAHFAVFPPELAETPILAGCPPGGTVLDPFAGSGTTLWVARQHGRNAIGIELNPDYLDLMRGRAKVGVPDIQEIEEVLDQ